MIIEYPAHHPYLFASGAASVTAAATILSGSLPIGAIVAVAAAALYLISKIYVYLRQPVIPEPATAEAKRIAQLAKRDGFVWFYKKEENPTTEMFGNFSLHPLTYKERNYPCAEAAFQAQKFEGNAEQMHQFEELDGEGAWKLARTLTKDWDTDTTKAWRKRNLTVMEGILQAKFAQEPLKNTLLTTGNSYLVEHIPVKGRDNFYGDDSDGTGQNQLGKLLMDIRQKLGGYGRVEAPAKYLETVTQLASARSCHSS